MLINRILEDDTKNCREPISHDIQLKELDGSFYELIDKLPDTVKFEIEDIFSAYMARVTRIAYLQGMKDFAELHVMLRDDVTEILDTIG